MLLIFACLIIFLAAIVRGFSGFGFSLLSITALSLIYAPAEIVPSIFMLELAASINLLPSIWKDIHWKSLGPLTLGCLVATPIGVWFLANIPAAPMQMALAIFVLAATALLAKGFALKSMPGTLASTAAGAASGLSNGAFGIGGPPVILFYFASPAGAAAGRASMTAFFLATDIIGLANQSTHGLITWDVFTRAALYLPALLAGIWIGARSFKSVDQEKFRKIVLAILAVLAVLIIVKAAYQLLH
ncbi:MAG: sulfite exporter TauE/SafE family protein [Alphaproteobacteria bacterium]|nr:sulfite exporter TauE/SafE family protein [Alphaproteobacteria bacterium]